MQRNECSPSPKWLLWAGSFSDSNTLLNQYELLLNLSWRLIITFVMFGSEWTKLLCVNARET